ncbi:GTP cyclohydrolase 1 type 2/Nif3 [Coniella lustricola]|uniref:GTP cyclohydrolase 1 type 2/Nif3 n=1 Tax=Coniella lustricola TaxID=2025994 RepID=A0A2T2ZZ29_9PEZI|nr:GTP cyclohydrolase 1 type 2/Nif3 [Coniella lustricola]
MSSLSVEDRPQNASFTQDVVRAMRALYPEELADRAWDNVGLLLGNLDEDTQRRLNLHITSVERTVLLTNDLTTAVAEEAIRRKASVVVSYHPFIFKGLKSINIQDPQQRILLQLAQKNIAVYCPHTAVDAVPGGLNDWLADMLCLGEDEKARAIAQPTSAPPPSGFERSGYGRTVEFAQPVLVTELVQRLARGLGGLKYVMVAAPQQPPPSTRHVLSAAVCAGSGWDVLKDCSVDVLVTGEMSHHSALRAIMDNKIVITVFHSNSEREYLRQRMQPALEAQLRKLNSVANVVVSDADTDPFQIWDVDSLKSEPST